MNTENREIEVRFLEINKEELIAKLISLGAEDKGEELLSETIFYDKDGVWQNEGKKMVRVRSNSKGTRVTYKNQFEHSATGTIELEFGVDDATQAHTFLEAVGLIAYRKQEKKRHTLQLGDVTADIDTWPKIPTLIELEGPSEQALKEAAQALNLSWDTAVFENPRIVIEKYYNIPVGHLKHFTFDKIE